MPIVQPPPPRYTVQDLENGAKFLIPSQKHWGAIFLFGIMLVTTALGIWQIGQTTVATFYKLMFGVDAPGYRVRLEGDPSDWAGVTLTLVTLALFGWVALWSISILLWQVAGQEVVEVREQFLAIGHFVFGLGRFQRYLVDHLRNLRVVSSSPISGWVVWGNFQSILPRQESGMIAFNYGSRTFRFGNGLDESEAEQLIANIQRRLPQSQP